MHCSEFHERLNSFKYKALRTVLVLSLQLSTGLCFVLSLQLSTGLCFVLSLQLSCTVPTVKYRALYCPYS
jgi:hypothetical protein